MKLVICITLAALSGCAAQQRNAAADDFSPSDRAAMISALISHQQPLTFYQQPFHPMQPIPVARPCCWY